MAEPLYGSMPQLWSPIPVPAFGFFPGPPNNNPLTSPGMLGAPASPNQTFMGSEITMGVTAPSLLAAVAVRRGQPLGPTNDAELEDFIYDALDLIPGTSDVEARCEGGRVTLTGTVPHKRLKRDVGEIAWALPSVNDVQNTVTIAARRRSRGARETEASTPGTQGRKQA
jgi:BON domain-containing protein